MTVRDGIAIFTAKTVTNREYIDNKLKEYDLKQTIQNINATVNSEYANDGKSLRFEMTTAGVLRFNHTSEYTTSHGKEFSTSFTYLTSD